jgi:glycosyltransferase involved in cell wall biosynthesis
LAIASIAVDVPMGAQNYQEHIAERAGMSLAGVDGRPWRVRRTVVRSMRSPLPGDRRIPLGAIESAPHRIRREVGRWLYGRASVVHRMNLELPPPPHGDVITLHDVVAWRYPDESSPVAAAMQEARSADAVICVSEFTAQEAVDFLGVRGPHVIPNGVDERFYDAAPISVADRGRLGIGERYVLHAGGAARRKNLDALADAWPRIHRERPDLQLVLAGPAHPRRTALFGRLSGTLLLGRVPDETVPGLVAAADAVVVPSLYEGFGLPVLEAMAANTLVVAANTSSLPEVAGDAAVMVEPTAHGIADGILTAVSGDAALRPLVTAGRARAGEFTWERSATAHARVWAGLG